MMVSASVPKLAEDRVDSFAGDERVAIGKDRTGGQDLQGLDVTVDQHFVRQAAVGEGVVETSPDGRGRRVVVCVDQDGPTALLRRYLGQRFGDIPCSPCPAAIGQCDDGRLGQVFEADEVGQGSQAILSQPIPLDRSGGGHLDQRFDAGLVPKVGRIRQPC